MNELLQTEILTSITVRHVLIILHLFGLALGAGAAFFSDFLFSHFMKRGRINKDEFAILQITSKIVWLGLILLILSGLLIFLGNSERLSQSPKFLAKMTIVGILTLNGIIFHITHIPMLKKHIGKNLKTTASFREKSTALFASGAISGVSWASALVLGSLNFVAMSYFTIMIIYGAVVLLAVLSAKKIQKFFLG